MARERPLSAEERALWTRVAATVRPLFGRAAVAALPASPAPEPGLPPVRPSLPPVIGPSKAVPGETLDAGWDRRLARGLVAPERTIDLHGHTLASAHATLDHALARAVADGVRLLLVVTGRPPRKGDVEPRRGLIRAQIGDWLVISPHAGRIAAVRGAHPRHGGAGALYIILRRKR